MALSREDEIRRRYEAELAELHREQRSCVHEWGPVQYDPEIKKEPYGYRIEHQGVDMWPVPEGYRDVAHDRWSRTCKKCGKVEYTTEQRPTKMEPYFNH